MESQPTSQTRDRNINQIASALMKQDEDAGIQWYLKQDLHNAHGNSSRLTSIACHLADHDLNKAGEWLAQQPDNITRELAEAAEAACLGEAARAFRPN